MHDWKWSHIESCLIYQRLIILQVTSGKHGETDRQPNRISSESFNARTGCDATI